MPTILLIDDSESIRQLLAQTLREGGHEVLTAADGKKATALLARREVHLVVTDIYMPEGDGIEVLMALKRMKHRAPAIAMSSITGALGMLHSAKQLGAKITLQKPFPPSELLRCANELLGVKPASQPI
jgi:DNA-binding NtrC family response regulator